MKAYIVPLNGKVRREFLVHANSAAEARDLMQYGDRREATALGEEYWETGLGVITRLPSDDTDDDA